MNILSFISTIVLTLVLLEAVYILYKDPKSRLNRLYFFMNICLFIWLLGAAFGYNSRDKPEALFWFRLSSFGFIFLHAFTLHFCMLISGKTGRKSYFIIGIYLPSFVFYYKSLTGLMVFKDFVRYHDYWIGINGFDNIINIIFMINYLIYYTASIILLVLWYRESSVRKKKMQALILILSISITVFLFNLEPFVLPFLLPYNSILISPIFGIFWVTGVWYAIGKYRFLDLHDSEVYRSIVDNTGDLIILFNENLEIKMDNKAFREATGFDKNEITGRKIDFFYQLNHKLRENFLNSKRGDIHTRILINTVSGNILTSTIFFSVLDSHMDFVGYAAVSSIVHSINMLEQDYNLSQRETEVVKYIISGTKNSVIAETLGITLRTVKTHVTNIYNKLGIENRIQLINLFNIYEKK